MDTRDETSVSVAVLHRRVLEGGQEAINELAARLLPLLRRRLRRAFCKAPSDFLIDGAVDAIMEYALRPTRFDSTRGVPLDRFLYQAAWRNTANRLVAETKRKMREARFASITVRQAVAGAADSGPAGMPEARRRLLSTIADHRDRKVFMLWLQGERRTMVLAAALGGSQLSGDEQRRAVKRFKDRITKRLRRRRQVRSRRRR